MNLGQTIQDLGTGALYGMQAFSSNEHPITRMNSAITAMGHITKATGSEALQNISNTAEKLAEPLYMVHRIATNGRYDPWRMQQAT